MRGHITNLCSVHIKVQADLSSIYRYVVESVYRLFVLDGHLSGRVDRARVIGDNGKQKKVCIVVVLLLLTTAYTQIYRRYFHNVLLSSAIMLLSHSSMYIKFRGRKRLPERDVATVYITKVHFGPLRLWP